MAGRFVGWRKMLAENVDRTRLCLGCDTRIKSLVIRKIALESTLQSHNDGAGRRVSARIESCFQPWSGLLLADLLACPWRVRDEQTDQPSQKLPRSLPVLPRKANP